MPPFSDSTVASVVPTSRTVKLTVLGIHCAKCEQSVETQLLQQPGVIAATLDLATQTAVVECTAEVNPQKLVDCLTEAGFPSQLQNELEDELQNELENQAKPANTQTQPPVHWALMGFLIMTVCFNLCLNAQVLTVGLAYFYNPEWWKVHVWLVRSYSGLSLILLIWVYRISIPRRVRSLTASLPVLLIVQFLTIHLKLAIPLAVVHPLIGFTLFSVSTTLVHRVNRFIFPKADETL